MRQTASRSAARASRASSTGCKELQAESGRVWQCRSISTGVFRGRQGPPPSSRSVPPAGNRAAVRLCPLAALLLYAVCGSRARTRTHERGARTMQNRWSAAEAEGKTPFERMLYASRLVGADPALVLWGGGNTSLKVEEADFRGRVVPVLRVKGSGSDLKAIAGKHFPGVRMDDVLPLFHREGMSDEEMVAYLEHTLMEPASPRPSIETLLHAFIPDACVIHSHADAICALTNSARGAEVVAEALGDDVAIVLYRRPGFLLSRAVGEAREKRPDLRGVVLMNHGLVTWADEPREAYEIHIDLVERAEAYAREKAAGRRSFAAVKSALSERERERAAAAFAPRLRGLLGEERRAVLRYDAAEDVLGFASSEGAAALSQIGPATPDHLLNTKRLPLFVAAPDPTNLDDLASRARKALAAYREQYAAYVGRHNKDNYPLLESNPRVVLVPGLGMWTAGAEARRASIAGEIYHHTISVMAAAEAVGGYRSLSERDAFEAEYWPLELYKLSLLPPEQELARRVALVTGAGGGIGKAIAERLAAAGAHVVVTDVDRAAADGVAQGIRAARGEGRAAAVPLDVTDEASVEAAFERTALLYGGLDILVSNAGIALPAAVHELALADWQRSFAVNSTGHFLVARAAVRLLRRQGLGGSIVFVATKNVPAPGKDFGAYSAAKAAETQLARVLAIENGEAGIRVNVLHPDAVFRGTNLWSREVREQRARAQGIAVDEVEEFYRKRNLLQLSVTPGDVAEAALFFASDRSSRTTGATLAVDGGVREAFPR
ncbi:MAG TPA: bifunctional rhamnulose-1-phosphate aldolase/short-chain dehydrogenase [Dehalococcoidia bacterium]|nr:bifunctional rhamnulose-1-phosphate aldolase/short-chain dehydrogenase [Dehalococcoidia bacterium]